MWELLWMMKWEGLGRNKAWPILRYYPRILLEWRRKIMKQSVRSGSLWDENQIQNVSNSKQNSNHLITIIREFCCSLPSQLLTAMCIQLPSEMWGSEQTEILGGNKLHGETANFQKYIWVFRLTVDKTVWALLFCCLKILLVQFLWKHLTIMQWALT